MAMTTMTAVKPQQRQNSATAAALAGLPAPIGHHGSNAMLLAFRDRYDAALRVPFPLSCAHAIPA